MTYDPVQRAPIGRRSLLFGGLRLLVGHPGALVWTYAANLATALLFSLRLHAQLSSLLDHSLAAQRLGAAFDLGVAASALSRLTYRQPSSGAAVYAGLPVYFLLYFLLVPGALAAYRLAAPARLGVLLSNGVAFFWRFVRITLLTVLVSALIVGPLLALQAAWSTHVEEHIVGVSAIYYELPGILVILLVAAFLRLYFDLVEVYTVLLDSHIRPNGKPDRRVRKTLIPAWKTLWRSHHRAFGVFILLTFLGFAAFFLTSWFAVHTLAQPRVWPAFLLFQLGIFITLAARYWQRAAETILVGDDPTVFPFPENSPIYTSESYPDPVAEVPPVVPVDPALYRLHGRGTEPDHPDQTDPLLPPPPPPPPQP